MPRLIMAAWAGFVATVLALAAVIAITVLSLLFGLFNWAIVGYGILAILAVGLVVMVAAWLLNPVNL